MRSAEAALRATEAKRISDRYKEILLYVHPDKGGDNDALILVNKANEELQCDRGRFRGVECPQREDRGRDAPGGARRSSSVGRRRALGGSA